MPDSGITKPQDLNGKTTGFAPGSATDQIFPAFAKKAGIDFASIKGFSVDPPTRDSLFLLKKIDFDMALAVAQLPILQERCGCKLNLMRFSDYGLNLMSNGIVASDKIIAENPDLVSPLRHGDSRGDRRHCRQSISTVSTFSCNCAECWL